MATLIGWNKEKKKKALIDDLENIFKEIQDKKAVSSGDFPSVAGFREKLKIIDWSQIKTIDAKAIHRLDQVSEDITKLMQLVPGPAQVRSLATTNSQTSESEMNGPMETLAEKQTPFARTNGGYKGDTTLACSLPNSIFVSMQTHTKKSSCGRSNTKMAGLWPTMPSTQSGSPPFRIFKSRARSSVPRPRQSSESPSCRIPRLEGKQQSNRSFGVHKTLKISYFHAVPPVASSIGSGTSLTGTRMVNWLWRSSAWLSTSLSKL